MKLPKQPYNNSVVVELQLGHLILSLQLAKPQPYFINSILYLNFHN